ncbi:MAG: hypothetical protein HC857_05605 [Synechococcales cyanobacterium RU_4_20]|nr:hypothetical protein [Synechococcales cyanobacterium RU_4_20]
MSSSDLASPTPLSSQLLFQLNWLLQLWATGAKPSPKVQAALVQLDVFQRWAAHHWSLQHPRLRAHQSVVDALGRRVGQQQFVVLVALLDAAAQIASNGHAEELAIALRYLTPTEQTTLIENLTRQWHNQPRWQRWLKLAQQVPGRTPSRSAGAWRRQSTDDIRSHLNALFDQPQPEIQALSLFLLHQLSLTEGLAQATHLLSHRVQLVPLLECVARAILNAAAEPVDLEDCSGLLQLLAADLET